MKTCSSRGGGQPHYSGGGGRTLTPWRDEEIMLDEKSVATFPRRRRLRSWPSELLWPSRLSPLRIPARTPPSKIDFWLVYILQYSTEFTKTVFPPYWANNTSIYAAAKNTLKRRSIRMEGNKVTHFGRACCVNVNRSRSHWSSNVGLRRLSTNLRFKPGPSAGQNKQVIQRAKIL